MKKRRGFFRMGVDPGIGWPSEKKVVQFMRRTLELHPETQDLAPSVLVALDDSLDSRGARRLVQEFLSGLVWLRRGPLSETFSISGSHPIQIGKAKGGIINNGPVEHVPDPANPRAKLALALYREAISVNLIPFQLLGFFKIINVIRNTAADQKEWIRSALPEVHDADARKRLTHLADEHPDVASYLYTSGRCAVAHAFAKPVVNPDDPDDVRRLSADLPLLKALAEHAIERELGVKSLTTIHREHLYELEGFRHALDAATLQKLKSGQPVDVSDLKLPARLSLMLREKEQLPSFENMATRVVRVTDGVVEVELRSQYQRLVAIVWLDFKEERLVFDALKYLAVHDDGSREALQQRIDALTYLRGWMANGVNEIWEPEQKERLGQSSPVLLVNWRPDFDAIDQEIKALTARLEAGRH